MLGGFSGTQGRAWVRLSKGRELMILEVNIHLLVMLCIFFPFLPFQCSFKFEQLEGAVKKVTAVNYPWKNAHSHQSIPTAAGQSQLTLKMSSPKRVKIMHRALGNLVTLQTCCFLVPCENKQ